MDSLIKTSRNEKRRLGVKICDDFFLPTSDGKHLINETTCIILPIEWEFGKGKGVRDSTGNFFTIGGKKNIK